MDKINKIVLIVAYIIILIFLLIIFDIFFCNRLLHLGSIRYNFSNDMTAYSYPYVGFVGQDIATSDKNCKYYNGNKLYDNIDNKIRIAFFGGSATVGSDTPGAHTIPQYIEEDLKEKLKKDVVVINYSCCACINRQHLHMLLEFMPKFKPDIIIYYSGNNEILQPYWHDPRPGYPFNYYYTNDLKTWEKFLLQYSAIIGLIDDKLHIWNISTVRDRIGYGSEEWEDEIINNFFETLILSKAVINTFHSDLFGTPKFLDIFGPFKTRNEAEERLLTKTKQQLPSYEFIYDFNNKYDSLPDEVWIDSNHVGDEANRLMAKEISDLIYEKYLKEYKK